MLGPHVVETGLEAFEIGVGVAIVIETQLVEIPQAAIDRKVAAPIIGIALERHALAGIDLGDGVRPAADRLRQTCVLEFRGVDGVLGQYRHQAEDERQFAVAGVAEIETHGALIERLGAGDLGIIGAVIGPAVIAQKLPGKDHVGGCHRRAVGKARRRIEREGDITARIVGFDRAGEQAVERERLVVTARHQALEHVAAQRLRRQAFDDERIKTVERAEYALHHAAAFGRFGIRIRHHGKIAGQSRVAMHGDAVCRLGKRRRNEGPCQKHRRQKRSACGTAHDFRGTVRTDGKGFQHGATQISSAIRGRLPRNCNRIRGGALSREQSGLSGWLSPGRGVTLLPHSAPKDHAGGPRAPLRAGTCQEADTQVDGPRFAAAHYEG